MGEVQKFANEIVTSKAYRLLKPREISEVELQHSIDKDQVVIEPLLASICHADLRYYTGQRRPEALAQKLPMSLIHEGIGRVVASRSSSVMTEQRVVIVPNIPGYLLDGTTPDQCCSSCSSGVADNYCSRGRFLGSGMDGLAQSRLVIPANCAIPIPSQVPDDIAVLTELCSVSYHALHRVKNRLHTANVAVFGDGPVGYLTAAMLHHVYGLDHNRLQVFGAVPDKLSKFTFAEQALVQQYDFTSGQSFDVVIECTGGNFSEHAINQAIDVLNPGGDLVLMGVSEERVPINTRDILEKGITVAGSSRSSCSDFHQVLKAMRDASYQNTLRTLLPKHIKQVHSAEHFSEAMEETAAHREWQKTLLKFHW